MPRPVQEVFSACLSWRGILPYQQVVRVLILISTETAAASVLQW